MGETMEGVEVKAGDKSIKIWGHDLIPILQLVVLCILTYGMYRHDADAATADRGITTAIVEQTKVLQQQLNAQREANCLNRLSPEQRKQEKEVEFCRSLGKGQ